MSFTCGHTMNCGAGAEEVPRIGHSTNYRLKPRLDTVLNSTVTGNLQNRPLHYSHA